MTKLTMKLTPCSKVLLQKLEVYQLIMKFLTFYGAQKFIIVLTTARHILSQRNIRDPSYLSQLYLCNINLEPAFNLRNDVSFSAFAIKFLYAFFVRYFSPLCVCNMNFQPAL